MATRATPQTRALAIATRALRRIANGREVSRGDHTEIVDRDDAADIAKAAVDKIDRISAREEADHAERVMLQEIADGTYGHNPAVRGAARDLLTKEAPK
jgi:hypothetical protein